MTTVGFRLIVTLLGILLAKWAFGYYSTGLLGRGARLHRHSSLPQQFCQIRIPYDPTLCSHIYRFLRIPLPKVGGKRSFHLFRQSFRKLALKIHAIRCPV